MAPIAASVHVVGLYGSGYYAPVYRYSENGVDFIDPGKPAIGYGRTCLNGNRSGSMLLTGGRAPDGSGKMVTSWTGTEWVDDPGSSIFLAVNYLNYQSMAVGEDGLAFAKTYGGTYGKVWRRNLAGVWEACTAGFEVGVYLLYSGLDAVADDDCWVTATYPTTNCSRFARLLNGSWAQVYPANTDFNPCPIGGYTHLGGYEHVWRDVFSYDGRLIWACGNRSSYLVVVTYDRDTNTWNKWLDTITGQFNAIWARANNEVYAVGNNGVVYYFDGSTWYNISPGGAVTQHLYGVYGNANGIWVCGASGRLMSFDGSWTLLTSGTSYDLRDVWVGWPVPTIPPTLTPVDPLHLQVGVSLDSAIEMRLQDTDGTITDGWIVDVQRYVGASWERAYTHGVGASAGWTASLTPIMGGYGLVLRSVRRLRARARVHVRVTAIDDDDREIVLA